MDFNKPLTFEEFKEAGFDAWKAQALKELKLDTTGSLQWKTSANIVMNPYYDECPENSLSNFANQINPDHPASESPRWWENRQLIPYKNEKETNVVILEALEGGADSVIIKINSTAVDFTLLFKDVKPEYCSLSIITGKPDVAQNFLSYLNNLPVKDKVAGDIFWENAEACQLFLRNADFNSIPEKVRCAGLYTEKDTPIEDQLLFIAKLFTDHEEFRLRLKEKVNITIFMDEDYFQNIARVKAARILLYQILNAFNLDISPKDLFIQAVSTLYKNEKYGPHENMLKGTTAAMAGITGGCNALIVTPGEDNSPLMRRIARNTSHILKEEAYFEKIIDPTEGSYFLVNLIDKTTSQIWSNFQNKLQ